MVLGEVYDPRIIASKEVRDLADYVISEATMNTQELFIADDSEDDREGGRGEGVDDVGAVVMEAGAAHVGMAPIVQEAAGVSVGEGNEPSGKPNAGVLGGEASDGGRLEVGEEGGQGAKVRR